MPLQSVHVLHNPWKSLEVGIRQAFADLFTPCSTENVDMVGRREHFLKSNFESLSGGLNDERDHAINNSISNKYKSGAQIDNSTTFGIHRMVMKMNKISIN